MEKTILNSSNDKEFMRMAMLKHEETFRQQVNELHRLYRIQKMLMESAGLNQQQHQQKNKQERYSLVESSKKAFTIDHYQQQLLLQQAQAQAQAQAQLQRNIGNTNIINNDNSKISSNNNFMGSNMIRSSDAHERIAESNDNEKMVRLDEYNEIELTLSLGPSSLKPRQRKLGKSESGHSISSSSTGSSQTKKKSLDDNRSSITTWGSFSHQGSGIEPGYSNAQQNNNPHWLYQPALSLKLT